MMQHKKSININMKLVSLAVTATLLSGCQSIWPDYLRPKVAVPAHYSETTDQVKDQANSQFQIHGGRFIKIKHLMI